jgi:hypothetical protein
MPETLRGLFRCPSVFAKNGPGTQVCVTDGSTETFISKSLYETKKIRPAFDKLPNMLRYLTTKAVGAVSNDNADRT